MSNPVRSPATVPAVIEKSASGLILPLSMVYPEIYPEIFRHLRLGLSPWVSLRSSATFASDFALAFPGAVTGSSTMLFPTRTLALSLSFTGATALPSPMRFNPNIA
jgi:hypothetical protein